MSREKGKSVVYFVRHRDRVKVGYTRNLQNRLKDFRTTLLDEFELIGTIRGGEVREQSIHRCLEKYRIGGEWFRDCQEVNETINSLLKHEPPPPAPAALKYEPPKRAHTDEELADLSRQIEWEALWMRAVSISRELHAWLFPHFEVIRDLPLDVQQVVKDDYDGLKDAIELLELRFWLNEIDDNDAALRKLQKRAARAKRRIYVHLSKHLPHLSKLAA